MLFLLDNIFHILVACGHCLGVCVCKEEVIIGWDDEAAPSLSIHLSHRQETAESSCILFALL